MVSQLIRLSRIVFLLCALTACGRGFSAQPFDAASDDLTGVTNKNGIPYTSADESADLEKLKQTIDSSSKANLDLAASIVSVGITRLDSNDVVVAAAPAKLKIQIQTKPLVKLITYFARLDSAQSANRLVSKDDVGANQLDAHCLDPDCAAVEVKVKSGIAMAAFIYRLRPVFLQPLGPFSPSGSKNPSGDGSIARLSRVNKLIANSPQPILVTTEVAWGPAIFTIRAGDVEVSGDLVATSGAEQNISVQVKGETAIEGRLIGNNNHGELLLRFADQSSWSFLRLRLLRQIGTPKRTSGSPPSGPAENLTTQPTTIDNNDDGQAEPVSGPVSPDDTPLSERYLPFDTTNPITAAFERDKSNSVIQDAIRDVSTGSRSMNMQTFLNRAQPNLGVMLAGLKTQNIPPELLFITFVESNYFYSDYDISVSSAGAVGPWQFMPGTAQSLGLKTFATKLVSLRNLNGKQIFKSVASPCDERADLDLSTKTAAKYLRDLFGSFPHDPKLAVMAYNMGAGGLNRRINCVNEKKNGATICSGSTKIQEYDAAGLDYWEIRRLHAAPKESIDYVPLFLAAQFVGREPSHYGLKVGPTSTAPAPKLNCK